MLFLLQCLKVINGRFPRPSTARSGAANMRVKLLNPLRVLFTYDQPIMQIFTCQLISFGSWMVEGGGAIC